MWTSTIDLELKRVALTRLIGRIWPGIFFTESLAPLRVRNIARMPLPATNWVRVRNRLAGICGSDLHLVYSDGDLRIAPAALPGTKRIYPGHELIGEVIEIGEDVEHLKIGDRVTLQHGPNCISAGVLPLCHACSEGQFALCERAVFPEPQQIGGGWSEEMLAHEHLLYRVGTDLSDEQAMMIEPSAVALHAVLRRLPQPGEKVLIIGAGTIGLLTLQTVRALAPYAEISVLARHPFQVEQATRMGAKHIIYPQDSYAGVQRATGAHLYRGLFGNNMLLGGYDVVYDTVGRQQTLHHALRWVRARGSIVLIGVDLRFMHLDLSPIWYREISLIGSMAHGVEQWPLAEPSPRSTFSIVEDMMRAGTLQPEQLVTHRFAINHYREALQTALDKGKSRAIKVAFDYSLVPATVVPNVRASARRVRSSTLPPMTFDDISWEDERYQPISAATRPTEQPALPATPFEIDEGALAIEVREVEETKEIEETEKASASVERKPTDRTAQVFSEPTEKFSSAAKRSASDQPQPARVVEEVLAVKAVEEPAPAEVTPTVEVEEPEPAEATPVAEVMREPEPAEAVPVAEVVEEPEPTEATPVAEEYYEDEVEEAPVVKAQTRVEVPEETTEEPVYYEAAEDAFFMEEQDAWDQPEPVYSEDDEAVPVTNHLSSASLPEKAKKSSGTHTRSHTSNRSSKKRKNR
jgi:2-desacetyl-2-hydroxyethyl bacteriochlorophyllide A dehydrogenase